MADDPKVPPGDTAETQSFDDVPSDEVVPKVPESVADPGEHAEPDATVEQARASFPAKLPERIGSYRIKKRLASGGMGTVYVAQQESPRRVVALKIMKSGLASKSALRRFEYESQILARLKHPNIAQVYEAGTHDDGEGGTPYFAMEYIPNAKSITEYVKSKKLGTRERLELFAKVCDAVHHGHQKGIIHRDLKPGNILVDSNGEPKIIDFGVARATDSDMAVTTLQTDIGQLIGTLQYMSPEQCDADPHDIDTRSDVYALGVVLFEVLTEQLPYKVSSFAIHEAARVIKEEVPTKLSTISRALRGDVETIILKALEKERANRYANTELLGDDIGRYLTNRPIIARPPSPIGKAQRLLQRNQRIVIVAGIAALLGVLITVFVYRANAEQKKSSDVTQFQRNEMGRFDIQVNLEDSISIRYPDSNKHPSLELDLIGVRADGELLRYENVWIDAYFVPGSLLRQRAMRHSTTMQFASGSWSPQVLSAEDPIWDTWRAQGVDHIVFMVSLPPSLDDGSPSPNDPRRMSLSIAADRWYESLIVITIDARGIRNDSLMIPQPEGP